MVCPTSSDAKDIGGMVRGSRVWVNLRLSGCIPVLHCAKSSWGRGAIFHFNKGTLDDDRSGHYRFMS